jgi:multiple sugar transport system permease protein
MAISVARETPSGMVDESAVRPPQRLRRPHRTFAAILLTPWLIGFAVFFAYPLVTTGYFSFTRFDLVSTPEWIGLRNWEYFLFQDPQVWNAVRNTLWFMLIMVPLRVLFGLLVAQVLIGIRRGGGVFRTVFYLPYLAPPVAATLGFLFLFNPAYGPVNEALGWVGIDGPLWFNDASWSKPGLLLMGMWGVGDVMVILLAGLLDVPTEQTEAAQIDGANAVQRFRYVTLPNIAPVLLFCLVTGVIQASQYFTQAVVAANVANGQANQGSGTAGSLGYPDGSTLTYVQWLYQMGFRNFALGYASVLALVLLAVTAGFAYLLLRRSSFFREGTAA